MLNFDGWRSRLPPAVVDSIDDAVRRYRWARAYEKQSPTVRETLEKLREIAAVAQKLAPAVTWLLQDAPIALAGIHEAGLKDRVDFGRSDVSYIDPGVLNQLAKYAEAAADDLQHRISPLPGEGQGAGSAEGRLSDFRIVGFDSAEWRRLFHFRSPKDILGFQVLLAIHGDMVARSIYGELSRRHHKAMLNQVWTDTISDTPPSWTILLRQLEEIKIVAADVLRGKAAWVFETSLPELGEDALLG